MPAADPPPKRDTLAARLALAIAAAKAALEDWDASHPDSVHDGMVDTLVHLRAMQQMLNHPAASEGPAADVITIARLILPQLKDHPKGLTRTSIGGRFRPATRKLVGPALQMLETDGWARCVRHTTGGRPAEVWLAATRNHNGDAIA